MSARISPLFARPVLCYVTDRHSLPGVAAGRSTAGLLAKVNQADAAGVDWVQIREKDLGVKQSSSLLRDVLQHVRHSPAGRKAPLRIIINDRLDLAIAEQADGVHLGESSLPVGGVKAFLANAPAPESWPAFLVGVSCHSLPDAERAAQAGADYLFFGPVFATPSKAGFGPPQGMVRLSQVCRAVPVPVMAIGGITARNAKECISAGAAGIAAIRLFQDAPDLPALVDSLSASFSEA